MALIPVAVHCGHYVGYDHVTPATGTITFLPLIGFRHSAADNAEYMPVKFTRELVNGDVTVTLLAPTESTDPSAVYAVTVDIPGCAQQRFVIRMPVNPATGSPLELASRDANQGILDPNGVGGSGDGGFGSSDGGFSGGGGGGTTDPTAQLDALYGLLTVLDDE